MMLIINRYKTSFSLVGLSIARNGFSSTSRYCIAKVVQHLPLQAVMRKFSVMVSNDDGTWDDDARIIVIRPKFMGWIQHKATNVFVQYLWSNIHYDSQF